MKKIKKYPKQKNKKLHIILICLIIITTLLNKTVKAGIQDSTLIKNRIEGIYAIAPLNDKTHLFYLQIYRLNNKISYCIEIGKDITTDIYNSTENIQEQQNITNLTKEQLIYIKAIAYFGYEYKNHTDYKYYMAAQELIWEYLSNINITWTNELNINGQTIDIESYKNEIKDLVIRYITPLSLPTTKTYNVGSFVTITDPNNSLTFYNANSQNNNTLNIRQNILEITIGKKYKPKDVITLTRKNYYTENAKVYNFENSQIILSAGNLEPLEHKIEININGTTLLLELVDKDTQKYIPTGQAILDGATYELYDENQLYIDTITINSPGTQRYNNLSYGKYYLKQTKSSPGYIPTTDTIEVNINSISKKVKLEEEVIKNTIEINKLYELEPEYQREIGIIFNIYDNNNNLYKSIVTTENGPDLITLPYGTYTIKQENTTVGYKKIEDIELEVKEINNTIIKYELLDQKIKTAIHVTTKNKKNEEKILDSNIKYKIKNKITNKYIVDKTNLDEFTTDEKGEITFPFKLPYGIYELEQTTPPNNYLNNKEKITIEINDNTEYNYINNEILINIDYYNKPIKGLIEVETNKEKIELKNNQFQKNIIKRNNIEIELYKENELTKKYKTNDQGSLIIDDLGLEEYCLIDKTIKEKKCIKIAPKNNEEEIIKEKIVFTQYDKVTNIIIKNIDENNNPIEGTTIDLYQEDNNINYITNEEGIIKINSVPNDNYCIKETKISNKYIINEHPICFSLDASSDNKTITIINKLNKKRIFLPNTFSKKKKIASYLAIIIITIIFIIKKEVTTKQK